MARFYLLAAAFFLSPSAAYSQPEGTSREKKTLVLLVSMAKCCPDVHWADAEKAALAEVNTLRTEVKVVDGVTADRGEWREELAAIALGRDVDCAFRIYGSSGGASGGVDLWITDADTGEITFRHIPLGATTDSEAAAIATLRALEAIRAGFLERQLKPTDLEGDAPVSPEARPDEPKDAGAVHSEVELDKNDSPAFRVGIGVGVLGAPGGAGALGAIGLKLVWNPIPLLEFAVDGALSVLGRDIAQGSDTSSFNLALMRGWVCFNVFQGRVFRPALGLGGGVAFTWTEGVGSPDFEGEKDRTQVAYLGAASRLGFVLNKYLWLVLGAKIGFLAPKVQVFFGDEVVASFGRPIVEGSLNLEVKLF